MGGPLFELLLEKECSHKEGSKTGPESSWQCVKIIPTNADFDREGIKKRSENHPFGDITFGGVSFWVLFAKI